MIKRNEGVLALALICLLIFYFSHNSLFCYMAGFIILVALISQKLGAYLDKVYMLAIKWISSINAFIILSLIFTFILTPLSLLARIFKSASKQDSHSSFEKSNHLFTKEDLINPW